MMQYSFKTSIFMQNFQTFYYEVLRQKEKALRTFEENVGKETTEALDNTVTEIQKKLHDVLESQSLQASKGIGGTTASYFRDAQYVMIALADETFLTMDWAGAKAWRKALMEAQIFKTQIAGEQLFKRLDLLLKSNEPSRSELAQVYLMALSMGFKGRYTEIDDQEQLDWYRDQLYVMIKGRRNELHYPGRERLWEDPYDYTISESPGKGLPDLKVWVSTFVSIFAVYIFISYVVWHKLASEMGDALGEIYRYSQQHTIV